MKDGKPENRCDELQLSLSKLREVAENSKGTMNPAIETNWLLRDISISLGLLVDITGAMLNNIVGGNANEPGN